MANISDYLDWRGDISFAYDPFNEVDSLVLSELIYTDFDGIVGDEYRPLPEVCAEYFRLHTEEEILGRDTFFMRAPLLLRKLEHSVRYKNCLIGHYENEIRPERTEQMAAASFLPGDGTQFIAFRGTDDTLVGWKEDFSLSYMKETPGQRDAVDYINRNSLQSSLPLRVGGHSKGGNFAVYASAFCDPLIAERILEVYNHDGPGFRDEILSAAEYQRIRPKIICIVPQNSIIGMLLGNAVQPLITDSSGSGIMQHDALTWQVRRNRFVRVRTRTGMSLYFEKAIREWLKSIEDSRRQPFIEMLFTFFEYTGASTLKELKENKKALPLMLSCMSEMPPASQKEFRAVIYELLKSEGEIALDEISERIRTMIETTPADFLDRLKEGIGNAGDELREHLTPLLPGRDN